MTFTTPLCRTASELAQVFYDWDNRCQCIGDVVYPKQPIRLIRNEYQKLPDGFNFNGQVEQGVIEVDHCLIVPGDNFSLSNEDYWRIVEPVILTGILEDHILRDYVQIPGYTGSGGYANVNQFRLQLGQMGILRDNILSDV